jgi:F-type H+-transporting ATPase subunit b
MPASLAVMAAAAAEAKSGLPQLNVPDFAPQIIWLAISFGVLYFLLSRFTLPRIGEVIEKRQQRIQRDLGEAQRLKTETENALNAYEQALATAKTNAGGIAKQTRDKLAAEVEAQRQKVERQLAQTQTDAEARIAKTKAGAMAQVDQIANETAAAIVDRLIGSDQRLSSTGT